MKSCGLKSVRECSSEKLMQVDTTTKHQSLDDQNRTEGASKKGFTSMEEGDMI